MGPGRSWGSSSPPSRSGCLAPSPQTSHFRCGFMGEPGGQWKCSENSLELRYGAMTRAGGAVGVGDETFVRALGVRTEHQHL